MSNQKLYTAMINDFANQRNKEAAIKAVLLGNAIDLDKEQRADVVHIQSRTKDLIPKLEIESNKGIYQKMLTDFVQHRNLDAALKAQSLLNAIDLSAEEWNDVQHVFKRTKGALATLDK